jgi:RNA polymerase sigma-70 factor (ECF subfamily)
MGCWQYLLLVANRELDADLRGKVNPSDVVQDTFLEAQRDFTKFQGHREDELLAWLGRILTNNLANVSRSYRRTQMRALHREVPLAGDGPRARLIDDLAADTPMPINEAAAHEEAAAVERALARLPEHYQRAIQLRYQEHRSFADIGAALNCSAEAARKLWARAVAQLQKELQDHYEPG